MNKLTGDDIYTPESYEEYKEIAQLFLDNGLDVYEELPIISRDRYNDYPNLSWDGDDGHLTACSTRLDSNIINTKGQFLHKAGIKKLFNGGKHLIHEFI